MKNYCKKTELSSEVIDHRKTRKYFSQEFTFIIEDQCNLTEDQLVELFYPVKKFFAKKRKATVTLIVEHGKFIFHIDSRTPADFNINRMISAVQDVIMVYCHMQYCRECRQSAKEFADQILPFIPIFTGKKLDKMAPWLLKEPIGQAIQELYPKFREKLRESYLL